jgi:hypothetical protein
MSAIRGLAHWIMQRALRCSRAENDEWAQAMLHEMDFIESDWAALWWALGCTTAIWRQAARAASRRLWIHRRTKEAGMNENGNKAVDFLSGVGLALGVAAVALGVLFVMFSYFPFMQDHHVGQWFHYGIGIFIPEMVFIVSTIALWRKRRPMAVGILLVAAGSWVHLAVHFAHAWRG